MSLISRGVLTIFRIERTESATAGAHRKDSETGALVLANHTSILDILVTSATRPCVFVTSKDMGETTGAGWLAKVGGSLFVERRNKMSIEADSKAMAEVLAHGMDIALYPEATSTNGTVILPFKAGLMKSAISVDAAIQPLRIQYTSLDEKPITTENGHRVFFYGEMGLFEHLKNVATNPRVKVDLRWLDALPSSKGMDPRDLANGMREKIAAEYTPVIGPSKVSFS